MRRHSIGLLIALTTLPLAGTAAAQDFSLQVGPPIAGRTPNAKLSLLVVRPGGCPNPASARITATAEGLVDGVRRTVPLNVTTLPTPGVHAVPKDVPNGGQWVVNLVGTCEGKTAGAIVSVVTVGKDLSFHREGVKLLAHRPTPAEIDASLKALTGGQ